MIAYQYDVVLSFAEEDRDTALALKLALENIGVSKVYYYPDHVTATWGRPLAEQLSVIYTKEAQYAVVFLSKHYFNKKFTNIEFDAMQKRIKQDAPNVYMLPILLGEDVELERPELNGLAYIKWLHNAKELARTITLLLGKSEAVILADKKLSQYHRIFKEGNYEKLSEGIHKAVGNVLSPATKIAMGITAALFLCGAVQVFKPQDDMKVQMPSGSFVMGTNNGRKDDMPTHTVELAAFYIGKREVTIGEYRKYCDKTGKSMPQQPKYAYTDEYPIVNITWQEAVDYCTWVKGRLPTEAEWEYVGFANKNDTKDRYSGGNSISQLGYYENNSGGRSHPVAQKSGGKLKIYDMSGNVAEWCLDWYAPYRSSIQYNPVASDSSSGRRVVRGGHYNSAVTPDPDNNEVRFTSRDSELPTVRSPYIGFRVVWDK